MTLQGKNLAESRCEGSEQRPVNKQQDKIKDLRRKLEKYKNRLQRQKIKLKTHSSPSPKKLANNLTRGEKVSLMYNGTVFGLRPS